MYDFYSDTKTKPSNAMLKYALGRSFGDEQKDEDPTTLELCERVAGLLGKESAVFLPSGTMCNEIAIAVQTSPGDEILCDRSCHIINLEGGAPAAMSGVMVHPLDGKYGQFTEKDIMQALRPKSRHMPISRMLCAEQTVNLGGGAVWPLEKLDSVAQVAKKSGLSTHLDGARLLNACAKTGISAARYSREYDSCWIDFTKGLGAPVGAVLAGSSEFIEAAWRVKQRIGGAMRQSGVIASFCLYALENNVERLAEDHALATKISGSLGNLPGIVNILPVETNIIIADLAAGAPSAAELVSKLSEESIHIGVFGEKRIRIVTHLDVNTKAAGHLIEALSNHLGKISG
jgi:threonine aldolase